MFSILSLWLSLSLPPPPKWELRCIYCVKSEVCVRLRQETMIYSFAPYLMATCFLQCVGLAALDSASLRIFNGATELMHGDVTDHPTQEKPGWLIDFQ